MKKRISGLRLSKKRSIHNSVLNVIKPCLKKLSRGKYYGSLRQLSFWTGKSKPTVIRNLKRLVEIGLLDREEVPYTDKTEERFYCRYWTSFSRMTENEQKRMLASIGDSTKTGKEN